MKTRIFASAIAISAMFVGAATAQQNPIMSAEELAKMFGGGTSETQAASPKADTAPAAGNVAFSAEELAKILAPTGGDDGKPKLRTRGLVAGGNDAPKPGEAGSGKVPDLKITFEFNSADLTDQARAQLDQLGIVMKMQQLSSLNFMIGGHTDAKGSAEYNKRLSQARADSVTQYLKSQHNVSGNRLQATGHGEERLADPANPAADINRRVEVEVMKTGG